MLAPTSVAVPSISNGAANASISLVASAAADVGLEPFALENYELVAADAPDELARGRVTALIRSAAMRNT